jgi:hypothetical protein
MLPLVKRQGDKAISSLPNLATVCDTLGRRRFGSNVLTENATFVLRAFRGERHVYPRLCEMPKVYCAGLPPR